MGALQHHLGLLSLQIPPPQKKFLICEAEWKKKAARQSCHHQASLAMRPTESLKSQRRGRGETDKALSAPAPLSHPPPQACNPLSNYCFSLLPAAKSAQDKDQRSGGSITQTETVTASVATSTFYTLMVCLDNSSNLSVCHDIWKKG